MYDDDYISATDVLVPDSLYRPVLPALQKLLQDGGLTSEAQQALTQLCAMFGEKAVISSAVEEMPRDEHGLTELDWRVLKAMDESEPPYTFSYYVSPVVFYDRERYEDGEQIEPTKEEEALTLESMERLYEQGLLERDWNGDGAPFCISNEGQALLESKTPTLAKPKKAAPVEVPVDEFLLDRVARFCANYLREWSRYRTQEKWLEMAQNGEIDELIETWTYGAYSSAPRRYKEAALKLAFEALGVIISDDPEFEMKMVGAWLIHDARHVCSKLFRDEVGIAIVTPAE